MLALAGRLNVRSVIGGATQRHFSMLTGLTMTRPSTSALRQDPRAFPSTFGSTLNSSNNLPSITQESGIIGSVLGLLQRRFKTRGNTYQPNTLKRKRTFGYLARLRTRGGRNVLRRRKAKGRWYLTH